MTGDKLRPEFGKEPALGLSVPSDDLRSLSTLLLSHLSPDGPAGQGSPFGEATGPQRQPRETSIPQEL